MTDLFKECPGVLLKKIIITLLLGIGCLTVGAIYYIAARDTIFLALSAALFVGCAYRSGSLYCMMAGKHYCVAEGVCIGITPKPMRRYRSVRFMDAEGLETTLLLDKRTKVKIGYRYRIYFKRDQRPHFGSEYLDTALSADCFLGIEELGEFSSPDNAKASLSEDKNKV